ncbi:MAG TPA: glycosyltransferase family 39 protein [Anaerolineales bacterium]
MLKKILSYEYTPIIALLILSLMVGVVTAKDYGESWDEPNIYIYANYSFHAYENILHPQDLQLFSGDLNFYGPAYFMLADASSNVIKILVPSLSVITAWHFIYFLTFLTSILMLYLLSKRWMGRWAAFGTALLFASQPLIWGHAFINPKDIPFMTFFLASIYFGLEMLDASPSTKWKWLVPAGIILGLTVSIRVIGPLAGLLVLIYAIIKFPRKIITTLPYYGLIAIITSYLTWPYLWKAPIANLLTSIKVMSAFPNIVPVLFMGTVYPANELPRRFFPTLLGLQLTETALILIAMGIVVSLWFFINGKNREPILLFTGWFLIPTLWIVLTRSNLYDNARQLLFLWPPLFIIAGMGMDQLMTLAKFPVLKVALLIVVAMPGIYASVQLHPYEYIYYNSLIGGVPGAYRKFELDYWATSFRESIGYIDQNVKPGSRIVVVGIRQIAKDYVGLNFSLDVTNRLSIPQAQPYYVLATTRANLDLDFCKNIKTVFAVQRDGALLSYVREVDPGQTCKQDYPYNP